MVLLTLLLTWDQKEKKSHPQALPRKEEMATGPQRHSSHQQSNDFQLGVETDAWEQPQHKEQVTSPYSAPWCHTSSQLPGPLLAPLFPKPQAAAGSQIKAFNWIRFEGQSQIQLTRSAALACLQGSQEHVPPIELSLLKHNKPKPYQWVKSRPSILLVPGEI